MSGIGQNHIILPIKREEKERVPEPKVEAYIKVNDLLKEATVLGVITLVIALLSGSSPWSALHPIGFVVLVAFLLDKRHYFKG